MSLSSADPFANHRIVLASRSPRRRELLSFLFPAFECLAADIDESPRPGEVPEDYARRLAFEKASAVLATLASNISAAGAGTIVIGADTVIDRDGEIMGKPVDAEEARVMLRRLANRSHQVVTGYAILTAGGEPLVRAEITAVTFDTLPDEAIAEYVASGVPLDRAGAYGIQDGFGALYIKRIDGDYNNVVGLPVRAVARALDRTSGART